MPISICRVGHQWAQGQLIGAVTPGQPTIVIVDDDQIPYSSPEFDKIIIRRCQELRIGRLNVVVICPHTGTKFVDAKHWLDANHQNLDIHFVWIDIIDNWELARFANHPTRPITRVYPGIALLRWLVRHKRRILKINPMYTTPQIIGISGRGQPDYVVNALAKIRVQIHVRYNWQGFFERAVSDIRDFN